MSDVSVHFTVPKGWKAQGDSEYVRTDYMEELALKHKTLAEGHMPWMGDPRNVAVACLWGFGIHDGSPVEIFADRLKVIRKGSVYFFTADSTRYVVYVKTKDGIPIAIKLIVKRLQKAAARPATERAGH